MASRTTVKYVQAQADTGFEVFLKCDPSAIGPDDPSHLRTDLHCDGKPAGSEIRRKWSSGINDNTFAGIDTMGTSGQWQFKPFKFSALVTGTLTPSGVRPLTNAFRRKQSEEEPLDKYGELGCIRVCIMRYHRHSSREPPSTLVDILAAEEAIP
jgi:hypothetical protein